MPTYKERESIRQAIESFYATGLVDEVIVVSNNAVAGTDEEVKKTRAQLFHETRQGYGYALRAGLKQASGHYIITAEPDGTFEAEDIKKFLELSAEYPAVLGSRIHPRSVMPKVQQWGNTVMAKMIEYLFWTKNPISDPACTYKLLTAELARQLDSWIKTNDGLYAPELVFLLAAKKIPFIQIDTTFYKRVGNSSRSTITAGWRNLCYQGLRNYWFVLAYWAKHLFGKN